jgi:hypothetical protein
MTDCLVIFENPRNFATDPSLGFCDDCFLNVLTILIEEFCLDESPISRDKLSAAVKECFSTKITNEEFKRKYGLDSNPKVDDYILRLLSIHPDTEPQWTRGEFISSNHEAFKWTLRREEDRSFTWMLKKDMIKLS